MATENPNAALRLFVAINLPDAVRDEIRRVQRDMQALVARGAVRWTRPDQFHLTLRFLGDVPGDRVEELKQAVGAVCRETRPLSLCAAGVGFFPGVQAPRVVWVGIQDGEGRLAELRKQIETASGRFSAEPAEKNFTDHVTLGRLRNPRPSDVRGLGARVKRLEKKRLGVWTADEVEIIRSELSSEGARHTPLAGFKLGGIEA